LLRGEQIVACSGVVAWPRTRSPNLGLIFPFLVAAVFVAIVYFFYTKSV